MNGKEWLREQMAKAREEVESWSVGKQERMKREARKPQISFPTEPPAPEKVASEPLRSSSDDDGLTREKFII